MRSLSAALLFLFAAAVGAAPGDSPFLPPLVVPSPMPTPVAPGVRNLTTGSVYVVNSKVDGTLIVHPDDLVTVVKKTGPLTIDATFIDGTRASETRDYPGPFVYLIKPVEGKSGRLRASFVPFGLKDAAAITRETVDVNGGSVVPPPAPKPVDPPPAPQPKPDPAPVAPPVGAWVIVIADESVPAPASLTGPTLTKLVADGRGHVYGTVRDSLVIASKKYPALLRSEQVTGSGLIVLDKFGAKVLVVALPATDAEVAAKLKGVVPGF